MGKDSGITRRDLIGDAALGVGAALGAAAVASVAKADDGEAGVASAVADAGIENQTVRKSAYVPDLTMRGEQSPNTMDELYQKVLDEPEPEGDLTLPDGRVVPAIYVKLRNRFNRMGHGCGSVVDEHSWDLLMYEWSEDEAKVCCEVPTMQWFSAFEYSQTSGRPIEDCEEVLDSLASRGLIARAEKSGKTYYILQPYIAGFWEATELKTFYENGEDPDACYEVLSQGMPGRDYGYNMSSCTLPMISSNPISKDVIAEDDYMPYFDWRERILSNTIVGVAACQCRIRNKALDGTEYPEECPTKRCMYMGDSGEYFISIGAAEQITPEEAVQIGEEAVDAGWVPEHMTCSDADILCFCNSKECVQLQNLKALEGTNPVAVHNWNPYTLSYDADTCISCGACIERCPMKAISFDDDNKCVHSDICIRCGQCASVCPVSARILKARDDFPYDQYPHDYQVDYMRYFAKQRMARGLIKDFTATELPEDAQ